MTGQRFVSPPVEAKAATRLRRILFAGIASQSIEFYDFLIYGTAAPLVFGHLFFPSVSTVAGVLASFATFAVGFTGRPIGAMIFGHIGDKFGRKPALLATMLLMAVSSTLIGVLPGYATIGAAAPVILVILRMAQGVSVGGQSVGATLLSLESAPPRRRGLFGALPQLGAGLGIVAGTLVFLLVSNVTTTDQFSAWGWRVPFLLSIVMFPVAYYVHRYVEDTPEFLTVKAKLAQNRSGQRSAVVRVLRHPKQVLLVTFTYLPATITFYVIVTGMLEYATGDLRISRNTMFAVVMLSLVAFAVGTVVCAWLSDLVGRRGIYAAGTALAGAWAFVLFPLIGTRSFPLILLGAAVGQFAVGAMFGPGTALFAEAFPQSLRYSGASLGYQLATVLGGGLAPFIMVALLAGTHTTVSVSAYMAVASAISLIGVALIRIPDEKPAGPELSPFGAEREEVGNDSRVSGQIRTGDPDSAC